MTFPATPRAGISAIVPVWNGRALLERLLASLEAQTAAPAEILAVDNGSEDGAPALAASRGARVIAMGRNAGFSAAVNRGIREAAGEWIAVLNTDVELAPDYLARLVAAAGESGAWFATGKILAAGGDPRIDATYDAVCRGGCAWRAGSGRADGPPFDARCAAASAPWTAALFRAALFDRAGLLEESFESYLEDVDFGLRCAALGLSGLYVPEALAWHVGSASLGRWHPETVRRIARNQLLLVARHYPTPSILRHAWRICVAQGLWGAVAVRHHAGWGWLIGKFQGIRLFAASRRGSSQIDPKVLDGLLGTNEQAILRTQRATGFDLYWRLYFLLTRGGTN